MKCAVCNIEMDLGADLALGVHTFHTRPTGTWAEGNRKACGFFHRGEVDPAGPEDHFLTMAEDA